MHDSFNLAWKINLVSRGLASPGLLSTYEEERRKIARDLINFDAGHCQAFAQGEAALAKNFDDNIRFISGVGAEYSSGTLTRSSPESSSTSLRSGALVLPARVTRYIDANPVDIQLDIPMLGQFRLYLFAPDVQTSLPFLTMLCQHRDGSPLGRVALQADASYQNTPRGLSEADAFAQHQRYTPVSQVLTYALVTQSPRSSFEIADLPEALQKSRWSLYLDGGERHTVQPSGWGLWDGTRLESLLSDQMGMSGQFNLGVQRKGRQQRSGWMNISRVFSLIEIGAFTGLSFIYRDELRGFNQPHRYN